MFFAVWAKICTLCRRIDVFSLDLLICASYSMLEAETIGRWYWLPLGAEMQIERRPTERLRELPHAWMA
jgi:hypothetical protein